MAQTKITLLCAGQEAPMPRAQGCAGAAGLKKAMDGLFQHPAGVPMPDTFRAWDDFHFSRLWARSATGTLLVTEKPLLSSSKSRHVYRYH
jgi:hypothetical protein